MNLRICTPLFNRQAQCSARQCCLVEFSLTFFLTSLPGTGLALDRKHLPATVNRHALRILFAVAHLETTDEYSPPLNLLIPDSGRHPATRDAHY